MKIAKQTWIILGGSVAILGILGYLYIYGKTKKAALAEADAKLAEAQAKGQTVVTKYVTVQPKTTSTTTVKSSGSTTAVDNSLGAGRATWTTGDIMYANYDNVNINNIAGKLTFNDGDVVGTLVEVQSYKDSQLAIIKNANGQKYFVSVSLLTN
jgi:ribosomal 30S subunit maturation factor RimM